MARNPMSINYKNIAKMPLLHKYTDNNTIPTKILMKRMIGQ